MTNSITRSQVAPLLRFLYHTQLDTHTHARTHTHTRAVGLLYMNDQLVAEAAAYTKQTIEADIHALSGIHIRDSSNHAETHLRLRQHGHRERHRLHLGL